MSDRRRSTRHHRVVILGGGAGGISVAARLKRARRDVDVCLIEPSERHWYQPLWTLVGAGAVRFEETERAERDLIPQGVDWLRGRVARIDPDQHVVGTTEGEEVTYEHLVVALGIQLDWDRIPGLAGNLGRYGICSNYSREHVRETWQTIREFRGGRALFTHPSTPIKCGGAPQKIMYLADDVFRRELAPGDYEMHFWCATPTSFTVEHYARVLDAVMERRGCVSHYRQELVELRPEERIAVFEHLDTGERREERYDMIHVTPMMSAPDVVKESPLANAEGWADVDKHTLRSVRYPDVWALGDCSSLPTSKTAAAVRKQAPVLAANLLAALEAREPTARYGGYTSCPLITGYGKLVLAEFDYDKMPTETFPFDQSKERWSMYQLKRHVLPRLYWQGMLKGRA